MAQITNVTQVSVKARKLSANVKHVGGGTFQVPSGKNTYTVQLGDVPTCTCRWGWYHNHSGCDCSHVQAAVYTTLVQDGAKMKVYRASDIEQAKRQHKPMQQIGSVVIVAR